MAIRMILANTSKKDPAAKPRRAKYDRDLKAGADRAKAILIGLGEQSPAFWSGFFAEMMRHPGNTAAMTDAAVTELKRLCYRHKASRRRHAPELIAELRRLKALERRPGKLNSWSDVADAMSRHQRKEWRKNSEGETWTEKSCRAAAERNGNR